MGFGVATYATGDFGPEDDGEVSPVPSGSHWASSTSGVYCVVLLFEILLSVEWKYGQTGTAQTLQLFIK